MKRGGAIGALAAVAAAIVWWLALSTEDGRRGPDRTGTEAAEPLAGAARDPAGPSLLAPERTLPVAPDAAAVRERSVEPRRVASALSEEELGRARWVEGQVLFPPGTPLDEQAFVLARGKAFEHAPRQRAAVQPDGRFRVAFSEETRSGWLALEARYLYLEEDLRWKSGEEGPLRLEPRLGGRLSGHLRVPAGTTVPIGGQVRLEEVLRVGNHTRYTGHDRTAEIGPGPDFTFAFEALPVREFHLDYEDEHWLATAREVAVEAGQTRELELELSPAAQLSGVVQDEAGQPLAGAEVRASVNGIGSWSRANSRQTETSEDGSFRLGGIAAGALTLSAQHGGHTTEELKLGRIEAGESRTGLVLTLSSGRELVGRVRWPDGTPAEAFVRIEPEEAPGQPSTDTPVKTGADGGFRVGGLTSGPYRVNASAVRTEEKLVTSELTGRPRKKKQHSSFVAEQSGVRPGDGELLLTLGTGLEVEGWVVDERGQAVQAGWLSAQRHDPVETWREIGSAVGCRLDDPGGHFVLSGLAPGEWRLEGRAEGHASAEALSFHMPGAAPLRFVLPREARVRGLVLDARGAPVANAVVFPSRDGESEDLGFHTGDRGVTDGSGAFRLEGLAPGPCRLVAQAAGGAPSEPLEVELLGGAEVEGLVLRLRTGGSIRGLVLDGDGQLAVGRSVSVYQGVGRIQRSTSTDSEGAFAIDDLAAGDYRVASRSIEGIQLGEEVHLGEGETVRVRLAPPDTRIVRVHGVLRAGGEPLAGALLYARHERREDGPSSSMSETDSQGAYELNVAGTGRTRFQCHDRARGLSWSETIDLPDVSDYPHDILIPLGRVSGRVTDRAGTPLEGVDVRSAPERHENEGHGSSRCATDAEGRYELVLPPGLHTVSAGGDRRDRTADGPSWSEASVKGVAVSENGHVRNIDLVLSEGGEVEGTVTLLDGSPAAGAQVWTLKGEEHRLATQADEQGRFRLVAQPPGRMSLTASLPEQATARPVPVEIVVGETVRTELTLVTAGLLHVVTHDGAGRAVGCDLTVRDSSGRVCAQNSGPQPGEAWVGPLPPGTYDLSAWRDGKTIERRLEIGDSRTTEHELVFD